MTFLAAASNCALVTAICNDYTLFLDGGCRCRAVEILVIQVIHGIPTLPR
jgi:hypothetical protein